MAHRSVVKPLGKPAWASNFLAASGLYSSSLMALLYAAMVGGIGFLAATPVLRYTPSTMAFLLMAMLMALRTRTSSNGFLVVL